MSVFGSIMSSIFGHGAKAEPPSSKSPSVGSGAPATTGPAVAGANTGAAPSPESPSDGSKYQPSRRRRTTIST